MDQRDQSHPTRSPSRPVAARRRPFGIVVAVAVTLLALMSACDPLGPSGGSGQGTENGAEGDPRPVTAAYQSDLPVNVGTSFNALDDAQVTGIRFWKAAATAGPFVGTLYGPDGRSLATLRVDPGARQGWVEASFAKPVALDRKSKYVVSVFFPRGHWPVTPRYFEENGPRQIGPVEQAEGVYLYAFAAKFPTSTTTDLLFVDPLLSPASNPAPPVTSPPTTRPATPSSAPSVSAAPTSAPATAPATSPASTPKPSSPGPVTQPPGSSIGACGPRPVAGNTGPPAGTRLTPHPGGAIRENGAVLDGLEFASTVTIYASNVTISNSVVNGSIIVSGTNATVDHVRTRGIGINKGAQHVIRYTEISGGADHIHIDSSATLVSGVRVESSYLHGPKPPPGAHIDGIQVRGVNGLQVTCSNLDLGSYQSSFNAAIYLEWASGGNRNVTIERNWLNGGGFAVYVDAENLRIANNRFGRAAHWGPCRNERRNSGGGEREFVSAGNVWDDTGAALNLCGQG